MSAPIAKRLSLSGPEPLAFLALSAILFAMMLSGTELAFGNGAPRFELGSGFQFEVGLLMAALALASCALRLQGTSFLAQLRTLELRRPEPPRPWVLVPVLIAVALGVAGLARPMRYDEAFAALFFVDGNWPAAFYYPLPNNHFAFTVLERLMPGDGPAWLRMPALLAWIASIPAILLACRRLGGSGQLATAGMAATPFLALYGSSARGYSLATLLVILMVAKIAAPGERKPDEGLVLGGLSALLLFVMPSTLFALAGLGLWALLQGWRPSRLLPWAACTALFATLLYIPVLLVNRASTIASNRFFARADDFGASSLAHAADTARALATGLPTAVLVALALLMALGGAAAWRDRRRPLLLLLPAMLAGGVLVFVAKQSIPFPRTWMFLVPIMLIVADAGWARMVGDRRWPAAGLLLAASGFAWHAASSGLVERIPDMGTEPVARAMAGQLATRADGNDWVCAKVPADALLRFYLQQDFPARRGPPSEPDVFYVGSPPALPVQRLTQIDGLGLYRLSGRPGPDFAVGRTCWLRGGHFFG
jgi:hypothetical protein